MEDEQRSDENIQMATAVAEMKKNWLVLYSLTGNPPKKHRRRSQNNISQHNYECAVYDRYQELLGKEGKIDFDDAPYYLYVLLRKNIALLNILRGCFRYLIIDECQDLDRLQLELIKLLVAPVVDQHSATQMSTHFIACGDPNQSIYSFRGGLGEIVFQELSQQEINGCKVQTFYLTRNYRSLKEIVRLCNLILPPSLGSTEATRSPEMKSAVTFVPSGMGRNGTVEFTLYGRSIQCSDGPGGDRLLNEFECVARKILRMKNDGMSECQFSDMMVLTSTNREVEQFKEMLDRLNIPHKDGNSKDESDDRVVVSTVHGAKGLEAANVFGIGCQAPNADESKKVQDERRRVFFVLLSRAKFRCYLSATQDINSQLTPSAVFLELQRLQDRRSSQDEEEELELGHDDVEGAALTVHIQYCILWEDENEYDCLLTKITKTYVNIQWLDEDSTKTEHYSKEKFMKRMRTNRG